MSTPFDLAGRTVLVTGASSGLGRAIAVACAAMGARVALAGRNVTELDKTAASCVGDGHKCVPVDLLDTDAIVPWVKRVSAEVGPLAGLVHSAGVLNPRPLRILDAANVDAVLRLNVGAAIALARGFRQRGVPAPGASIVFLSSVMGLVGQPGLGAYSASKGALVGLSRSLALELAPEGIRVNCIAPGVVRTEMAERFRQTQTEESFAAVERMHPLGLGQPDDVANAAIYLLSPASRWVTGTALVVDGGYTAS